jgi:NADPH:quinone reductase-like Zn-dependent oxidoreductase
MSGIPASPTMKAALASGYGEPAEVLTVQPDGKPRPTLGPDAKDTLLIRVLACSLSPSDWRTLSGDARLLKKPAAFPYVPGGDVCGIVEEVHPDEAEYKVGDVVIGSWTLFGENGLAEYYLLDKKMATKKPEGMSAVEAAAMANSLVHAHQTFLQAEVKAGERVLVLGGSGGMGSIL